MIDPPPLMAGTDQSQGTTAGAPACAQCHGFDGISDGTGAFPRIAGQSGY
jgi:cytochrome c553